MRRARSTCTGVEAAPLAATALLLALTIIAVAAVGDFRAGSSAPPATDRPVASSATSAPPLALAVPRDLPDSWRLSVVDRVLLALPWDWGPIGVPGGEAGRRDISIVQGDNLTEVMHVTVWSGRSVDEVTAAVAEPHRGPGTTVARRDLALDGRSVREVVFTGLSFPAKGPGGTITFEARHLVTVLGDRRVADVRVASAGSPGRPTTLGAERRSEQDLVTARLFAMGDADVRLDRAQVERALSAAISLTDPQTRGSELTGGDTTTYRIGGDDRTFVYIATYPTRRERMNVDPNEDGSFGATVSWIAPVTHRGIGNAFIVVGAKDVNVRYRAVTALDAVVPRGAQLPAACDPGQYVSRFASLVRSFGVAIYQPVFQRLTDDATWRFDDPRGTWPSNETLRGPDRLLTTFVRQTPVVEIVDMANTEIQRTGDHVTTPPAATVRRMDRTVVPLRVEATGRCVDGDVRFGDVLWRFGG